MYINIVVFVLNTFLWNRVPCDEASCDSVLLHPKVMSMADVLDSYAPMPAGAASGLPTFCLRSCDRKNVGRPDAAPAGMHLGTSLAPYTVQQDQYGNTSPDNCRGFLFFCI